MTRKSADRLILPTLLIGYALRLYQLGQNSFWNDEAGQALAAIQPTLSGMLRLIEGHAMAMPLDYMVSRLMSLLGPVEMVMRYPTLMWAVLTLALYYAFARQMVQPRVALLTAWILSWSVFHLHYSQEMRFYSALIFFYGLSTWLLLRAVHQPTRRRWGLFVVITSVGAYFHPFVLLATVNGFFYLVIRRAGIAKWQPFLLSGVVVALLFLPGYWQFGGQESFAYPLVQWGGSVERIAATGLGWLAPYYCAGCPRFGWWEVMVIGFALVGVVSTLAHWKGNRALAALMAGVPVQVGLILLANVVKGYWFLDRQLIHLLPVMIMLSAAGASSLVDYLSPRLVPHRWRQYLLVGIMAAFSLAAIPRLSTYYAFPKGNGRLLATALLERNEPDAPVFVLPGHEGKIYEFYFEQMGAPAERTAALQGTDWEALAGAVAETPGSSYLIAPAVLSAEQEALLERLGFAPLVEPDRAGSGLRILFVRDGDRS